MNLSSRYSFQISIASHTKKDVEYTVSKRIRDGKWICSCPHNVHRKVSCKNIKDAREHKKNWEKMQKIVTLDQFKTLFDINDMMAK